MKLIFIFPLFFLSSAAVALSSQDCDFWKEKANLFMNWRQQEISITDAVKDTTGNISRGLLLRAYNEPVETGFEEKYATIEKFTQQIYQECLLDETNKK